MNDLKATFNYTNGLDFPQTKGVNSSTGTSKDGTEFKDKLINDIWGFFQASLNSEYITPSGNDEEFNNSQILDALREMAKKQHYSGTAVWRLEFGKSGFTPQSVDFDISWCLSGGVLTITTPESLPGGDNVTVPAVDTGSFDRGFMEMFYVSGDEIPLGNVDPSGLSTTNIMIKDLGLGSPSIETVAIKRTSPFVSRFTISKADTNFGFAEGTFDLDKPWTLPGCCFVIHTGHFIP